ncbi:extracellular solute-binding protein [Leucobacter sp. UT-8R-CII-1-4]|uniref:extracellular solute-binding protein n=1 Tax=Leucobacter sp. UT-8R-CII-1-4 TaxID=3040075 RepID=UPI0024A9591D|nr:extracellular solute-binding protein [Leucobacter sp. UT-8R-CII-1-4]MDI6024021.1 extracellular solute-binding protein [Leucobacter sp. UT-8R-CII-1-4]
MKRITQSAAVVSLAVVLAACSGGNTGAAPEDRDFGTPQAGVVKPGILDGVTMAIADSGGISQEGRTEAVWEPFMEESGAEVVQDSFEAAKLKAMVESGNVTWDIANTTVLDAGQYCGELYEKLDYSMIDISKVPEGTITNDCMVPTISYGFIVAYNTDAFGQNAPNSAADFFDTEKFPGKRAIGLSTYAEPQVLEFALLAEGKGEDQRTVADIDAAIAKYKSLGNDLITWTTGAESQQQLESGEVVMSLVWSSRGFGATDAGAPIAPMWGDWILGVDALTVPKGAKDPEAAFAGLNFFLGEQQQTKAAELTSFAPVNVDSKPELSDTAKMWFINDHLDTGKTIDMQFWTENYSDLEGAWTKWASGS